MWKSHPIFNDDKKADKGKMINFQDKHLVIYFSRIHVE